MKTGRSLSELALEIERQSAAKQDLIADTRTLQIVPAAESKDVHLVADMGEKRILPISDLAHRQIAARVGIGQKYYDRMRVESPELLATNVNHWFANQPETRMVRTLDGRARAFLSNRFQRIDNKPVAETALAVLGDIPGIRIASCEITENRFYIKAITSEVRAAINSRRVGDFVEAGVVISNSEVGLGRVLVLPFFHFLACTNGMIRNKDGLKAAHIGAKQDADENIAAVLAEDTRAVLDKGVLLKVRDVVRAAMDAAKFQEAIERMQAQTEQLVKGDPAKAIELLGDDFSLNDGEQSSVLRHLIQGGDISRYGFMNAITRTAEDAESYDRATEIEELGGRLIDLPDASWKRIAEAA